jgi:hypothetical protein
MALKVADLPEMNVLDANRSVGRRFVMVAYHVTDDAESDARAAERALYLASFLGRPFAQCACTAILCGVAYGYIFVDAPELLDRRGPSANLIIRSIEP